MPSEVEAAGLRGSRSARTSPSSSLGDADSNWLTARSDGNYRSKAAVTFGQLAENSFVPTTPTTINAMKPIWTPFTFSPNRMMPPMITPMAPSPVQIA